MKLTCKMFYTLLMVVMSLGVPVAMAEQKVGILDIQKLMNKAPQAASSKAKLEKIFNPKKEALDNKQKALANKVEQYKRNVDALSDGEKVKKEREITRLQQEVQQTAQEFQDDYVRSQKEEMDKFMRHVKKAVAKVAKKNSYAVILHEQATIFSAEAVDITSSVLQALNEEKKS